MGQHRMEPGKYKPYEPDIHVPLLVRGPGVPKGVKVDALTLSVDFAPTFAELAGATLPVEPDGRSLVPLLEGKLASCRGATCREIEARPVPAAPF